MTEVERNADGSVAVFGGFLAGGGTRVDTSGEHVTALLDALPQAAFLVAVGADGGFRFVHMNGRYRDLLQLAPAVRNSGDLRSVLPADALVAHVREFAAAVHGPDSVSFETNVAGRARAIEVHLTPLRDETGACVQLLGIATDVTDRAVLRRELAHRTRHDPLTELPNRVRLFEAIGEALERGRTTGRGVGVVLFDLDAFKVINDSLGHEAGDELLTLVAGRVHGVMRGADTLARAGGDELAIVCNDARSASDPVALARRVRDVFARPFDLQGRPIHLSASFGVSLSDGLDDDPGRLLRDADVAMHVAKRGGRGAIALFAEPMRERAVARLQVEEEMRLALERDEFRVHYQPLVRFDPAEVIGFEALVRWEHPARGLVPPMDFLPLAEETGLILPIGAWVLRAACEQAARWRDESVADGRSPLSVSVNLSARQLNDPDLVDTVDRALADFDLPATLLVLEITESVLMEDRDRAVEVLHELTTRGVRIGIDDFGTGQSSLGYLKNLPVHTLKIDRSFIDRLGADPEDSAIVAAVVDLGHALGLTVTAEGIETPVQLSELRALGCDLGQGYYFARPQPGDIVRALVHHPFQWRHADSPAHA